MMGFFLLGFRRNIFLHSVITALALLGIATVHWHETFQNLYKKHVTLLFPLLPAQEPCQCSSARLPDGLSRLYKLYDEVNTFAMFIGYSEHVHSLVGAVLDAHPEILIPQNYDILGNWWMFQHEPLKKLGQQKRMLFYHLQHLSNFEVLFKNQVNRPSQFWLWTFKGDDINYKFIPGAWQGTFKRQLKVIGDASGVVTSKTIQDLNGNFSLLEEIQEVVGIPVRFLHIITNPFDSIASIVMTRAETGVKINDTKSVTKAMKTIFELLKSNQQIRQIYGNDVLDVYGHDLRLKQTETLQKICTFLGVQCDDTYFKLVENIVNEEFASRPRDVVVWREKDKDWINSEMKKFAFLQPFWSAEQQENR